MPTRTLPLLLLAAALFASADADARTVYRCVQGGTVSLSTAPEPGSKCEAREVDDTAAQTPNLWGAMGVFSGVLYEREQDGVLVYGTRRLPGAREYLRFTVATPEGEPAHVGLGQVAAPRLDRHAAQFRQAARRHGIDEALLRAVAHAESNFDERAVSPKGAMGVMQLMPAVAAELGVQDPFAAAQSIDAGARHLKALLRRYDGDVALAIAAYNAGPGAVARYDGVPPFAETRAYLAKVEALRARYHAALSPPPLRPADALPVARTPTPALANPGIATQVPPPAAPPVTTLPGGVLAAPAAP